ncbi:MAG: TonB-dependent receptor [Xanthomonadaceae bacterium]|nr:TonB-dependent receptor [Xanthomonadaceae bacterium]MDE2083773.1 TonB-dependent receptor [Xanthomonadaceae bacterium]MDE2257613.1 TonB-dependent receptor [Xanthomonadaceae bacterium]
MLLKRNAMTLALISAGIGLMACTDYALAADTVAAGAQDQTQPQAKSAAADQDNKAQDKKKNEKAAAEKQTTQLQEINVKGYAGSLQNATAIKRNSDEIVEAVSAEQIGKLPGTSIADVLGRLPGLAVQTLDGRPQVLTIHGLGPDFSTALVNGREQVSTSNNRDVQYDQYPASWFNNVVVYLSPSAGLIGQGLSGTVDMRTIRPLEQNHPIAAVNARYVWDSLSTISPGSGVSDRGYSANGIWVNQFADHTFGVTLGVDLESNPAQIEHQQPWGYPTDGNGDLVIGGSKNYGISDQLKRTGLLGTLQYQPSENFTSTLDLTYDNFRETQQAKGMEFPLWWSNAKLAPGASAQNGFVTGGTYDDVVAVVRNDYNRTKAKVWNIGWNNKIRFNEDWSASVDASYSRADRRDMLLESYSGTGYNKTGPGDTLGFTELGNGLFFVNPSLNYTQGLVLTDPQGWGSGNNPPVVQAGFINAPHTNDYLARLRAAVEYDFAGGPFANVKFGFDRATRDKTYNIDQDFLVLPNGAQTAPIPSFTTGDPLAWMGVGPQVIYNPLDLIANGNLQLYSTSLSSIGVPPNWKVRENDVTPFAQFNLDSSLGDVPVRGNIGVQVAHTNQGSQGQRVAAGTSSTGSSQVTLVPVSGGTSYTRWLPSANLVFEFTPSTDLRVGAARVMARPRMDQMSASLSISGNITHLQSTDPNTSYFSASGGNPELLPSMANNFNVSLEHYFGDNQGYMAASAYYLKLSDYINPSAAFLYNFAPFVGAFLSADQQQQLGTTYGIVSGPTNDGSGNVKGLQGTINLPFNMLTPVLDGFGAIITGDRTNSSVTYAGNSQAITVPGLSKWVGNGTLYYQHDGFEARVSDSYRSSFLGEVQGISATRILQTIQGGSTYDAQVSYTIPSGRFKGLTILLQGSNLTDKRFITYQNNDPRQVLTWEDYGRRYELGISYKFQ